MDNLKSTLKWINEYFRLTPEKQSQILRRNENLLHNNNVLDNKIQGLEEKLNFLSHQNRELTKKQKDYESQILSIERENQDLTDQRKDLKHKINHLTTSQQDLTQRNQKLTDQRKDLEYQIDYLTTSQQDFTQRNQELNDEKTGLEKKIDYNKLVQTALLAKTYLQHPEFFENLGINISLELRNLALSYKQTAEIISDENEELKNREDYVKTQEEELRGIFKGLESVLISIHPIGTELEESQISEFLLDYSHKNRELFDKLAEGNEIYATSGETPLVLGTSNRLERTGLIPEVLEELSRIGHLNRTILVKNDQYWLKLSCIGPGIYKGSVRQVNKKHIKNRLMRLVSNPIPIPQTHK